jgi:hypothetical protein
LSTAIPGGTGMFTGFTDLAAAGSLTAFIGTGSGQGGVYGCDSSSPVEPCHPIADLTTAIPGGIGAFSGFTRLATAGTSTSFIGTGAGQQGIYHCESAIPTHPCQPIADLTTAIPGGTGTFTGFNDLAARGTITSFVGTGDGQQGVYRCVSAGPVDPCQPIADLTTAIPGGTGTFMGFTSLSASLEHSAFLGLGDGGQAGIYLASALTKIAAVGDTLEGKVISALRLGRSGLEGTTVAFTTSFTDGSEGVFVVGVGRYSFDGFLAPVANPPALNRVQAGKGIPVRFSLGGDHGLAIFAGYPQSAPLNCDSTAAVDGIQTVTAGASGLSYDAASDSYTYVWKTDKAWAKTCRQLIVRLKDGTVHHASFTFR